MSKAAPSTTSDLHLAFAGTDRKVRLSYLVAASGNGYWTAATKAGKWSKYGIPIPALADELPTSVTIIDPVTGSASAAIALTPGMTTSLAPKVSAHQSVDLPNGLTKSLSISVSETALGWNLVATANGGGGGGSRKPDDSQLV